MITVWIADRLLGVTWEEIESNGLETITDLGWRHRMSGVPQHDSTGVGHSPKDVGRETTKSVQRADGLRELGEAFVDVMTFVDESLISRMAGPDGPADNPTTSHASLYLMCKLMSTPSLTAMAAQPSRSVLGSWPASAKNIVSFFRSRAWLRPCDNARMMLSNTMSSQQLATPLPLPSMPTRHRMERAYQASDVSYDGVFYLGVPARPACSAGRRAGRASRNRKMSIFSARPKDAAFCRLPAVPSLQAARKRPGAILGRRALLDRIERQPGARIRESDLRAMGVEPARVRRYFAAQDDAFKAAIAWARRLARAFERIREGETLDDAVFETGYESHSVFREAFQKAFGQPP